MVGRGRSSWWTCLPWAQTVQPQIRAQTLPAPPPLLCDGVQAPLCLGYGGSLAVDSAHLSSVQRFYPAGNWPGRFY